MSVSVCVFFSISFYRMLIGRVQAINSAANFIYFTHARNTPDLRSYFLFDLKLSNQHTYIKNDAGEMNQKKIVVFFCCLLP